MINEVVGRVFADRDAAHTKHLGTKSYAEHICLGAFYHDVIESVDALAEAYMGMFGTTVTTKTNTRSASQAITERLQETADFLEENRDEISQGSPTIGNLVDTLAGVYAKTLFLLGLK